MYRCSACNKVSQPGDGCNIVPFATRPKIYYTSEGIEIGRGRETVSEGRLCLPCLKIHQNPLQTEELK